MQIKTEKLVHQRTHTNTHIVLENDYNTDYKEESQERIHTPTYPQPIKPRLINFNLPPQLLYNIGYKIPLSF